MGFGVDAAFDGPAFDLQILLLEDELLAAATRIIAHQIEPVIIRRPDAPLETRFISRKRSSCRRLRRRTHGAGAIVVDCALQSAGLFAHRHAGFFSSSSGDGASSMTFGAA